MTESSNIIKPLNANTRIEILSRILLEPLVKKGIISIEHLKYASEFDYIDDVYYSDNGCQYTLCKTPLLWPQKAILPLGNEIRVDHAILRENNSNYKRYNNINETEIETMLFVGNLPFDLRDCGLINIFSKFGTVKSAQIILDKEIARSRGFGYVTMLTKAEAIYTKESLNGVKIVSNGEFLSHYSSTIEQEELNSFESKKTIITIIETASKEIIKLIYNNPEIINQIEWRDLERIIATILDGMGYKITLTRPSKDGGKDIIVEFTDKSEKKSYFIEIKHWVSGKRVGKTQIRHFLSVIVRDKPNKGIIISTSGFSETAFEGIIEFERRKLQIGDRSSIYALCRRYMNLNFYQTSSLDFTDTLISCTKKIDE